MCGDLITGMRKLLDNLAREDLESHLLVIVYVPSQHPNLSTIPLGNDASFPLGIIGRLWI